MTDIRRSMVIFFIVFTCLFLTVSYTLAEDPAPNQGTSEGDNSGEKADQKQDNVIVLKSMIVNPSQTQSQKIPFKQHLPKEISPKNIIDAGDLEIDFDYQAGQYFVFKEYELKPGETKVIKITLLDIWKIPTEEIEELKKRSEELIKKLEETGTGEGTEALKEKIASALKNIDAKMGTSPITPVDQMKQYNDIMELLTSMKADMAKTEEAKKEEEKMGEFGQKEAWKIIITIIVSLGVLSSIFFYLWYKKIKPHDSVNLDVHPIVKIKSNAPPPQVEKKVAKEDKKVDIGDIENILNRKP